MGFGHQFTEFTGREEASDTTYSFLYELMGNKHNDLFLLQCVFFTFHGLTPLFSYFGQPKVAFRLNIKNKLSYSVKDIGVTAC